MDWDNYEDSPSYGLYHKPLLIESLQVNDCLSEIQSLSEGIKEIALVEEPIMSSNQQSHVRPEWESGMIGDNEDG